jgi:hypothetical protein
VIRPTRTQLAVCALALAAAVTAFGCGGGDDGEQVSAEELLDRGDRVCQEGQQRFAEIQRDTPADAGEAFEQTEELAEVASEELDELERLDPPGELDESYDRYLEARGEALDLLERGRDAAEDRDAKAYDEAQNQLAADQRERIELARAVGFEVCSKRTG